MDISCEEISLGHLNTNSRLQETVALGGKDEYKCLVLFYRRLINFVVEGQC